jgi:osmotically-inducible protein OsmY
MAVYQPVHHQPGKGVTVMKTINTLIRSLLLIVLVVGVAACGSTSKQSGPGEYVDDSVITTKVKSQLAGDDFLKSFEISVETYKGVVQLSGFVDSQTAVNRAGEIARRVQGVSSVKNNLNVKK